MSLAPPVHLSAVERRELTEAAADFARRRIAPLAPALDRADDEALCAAWAGIRELGLERALLPAAFGGAGIAAGDLLPPLEELARGDAGIALCVLLSNAALLTLPADTATVVAEDERWAAVLVPDPPAAGARTVRVSRDPEGATVSGRVLAALGAEQADRMVVLAGRDSDEALVLAAGADCCTRSRTEAQMGLRSAVAADVRFERARADLAAPSEPARALVLSGIAAIARGIARRSYEISLAYAENRHQGGVAIVEHGAVRAMLAAMAARLRDGGDRGLGVGSNGAVRPAAEHKASLAAKVRATDDALATATDAVQVLGGTGYMRDAGAEKLMRDARYCQLYPEPNWVARDRLLDLERQ